MPQTKQTYHFEPYDILQIKTFGVWEDFYVLKDNSETPFALSLCDKGTHRIVSPNRTVVKAGAGNGTYL